MDFTDPLDLARFTRLLDWMRKWCLERWKRNVERSFKEWFYVTGFTLAARKEIWRDGLLAVEKAKSATWFDWPKGSSIFFWRWPPDYVETVRVGVRPFFDKDPPQNQDRQPPFESEEERRKVKDKLSKVLDKGYVELCDIQELEAMMYMFSVPKGETDIRMVYDGSRSGLNESLWAPWFALPTLDGLLGWTIVGSWRAKPGHSFVDHARYYYSFIFNCCCC